MTSDPWLADTDWELCSFQLWLVCLGFFSVKIRLALPISTKKGATPPSASSATVGARREYEQESTRTQQHKWNISASFGEAGPGSACGKFRQAAGAGQGL